ncbi:hypothetical protein K488DRAFT_86667 [Vararia minispora EC-137]|uniref:Uncharacterized protein n=1 Tax=Vararia minispora EC-137 TaxID=1314806 RepID=A0ACB8QID1_9AGAM|nr:hypothetical protein K488DRAFT_86667 [Vararia minispora EC-137]
MNIFGAAEAVALDKETKGIDSIQHAAGPIRIDVKIIDELFTPTIRRTVGILVSAKNFGFPSVRRVVALSLGVAIATYVKDFDETCWSDPVAEELRKKGDATPPQTICGASKYLAEKATWDFKGHNNGQLSWVLVAVNPPFTCATELSRAARAANAGRQRFIFAAAPVFWQDIVDAANEADLTIPVKGAPGATKGELPSYTFDTSKAARVLGMTDSRSLEAGVKDSFDCFKAHLELPHRP